MATKNTTKTKPAKQVAEKLVKVKTGVHRNMKVEAAKRGLTIGGMLEQDYGAQGD